MGNKSSSRLHGAPGYGQQCGPSFTPYEHQEAVTALAASHNNFTRDLYVKLAAEGSGNLFFSPFSIMTALGMTYAGARGNTEQQMRSVMHLGEDTEATHDAFKDVVSDLKTKASDYELSTSNKVYVSKLQPVLSEFDKVLKKKYLSTSKTVDFEKSEEVRQEINAAVEEETKSRIKDLIPKGVVDRDTSMMLVNAIYFKGYWVTPFEKERTHDGEFWISRTQSVKVPMMYENDYFRLFHFEDLAATALEMDYKGSRFSMVILLPDERDGLARVEAKLSDKKLTELDQNLTRSDVAVTLPKFKLEETLNLVDQLKKMGMEDLFEKASADLSGISGTKDQYVSHVIHKAFLKVDEAGSEAAAATGLRMRPCCFSYPVRFVADHPFLFFIKDVRSGLVLFSGRLTNPV